MPRTANMPPQRSMTAPKPPKKTERTHEENQERAYIAASRRSDRSIEARVESARRASDVHQMRTGRRLRITEKDVANEEMYEEEDDSRLAMGRLAMTGAWTAMDPDFQRRMQAAMALQVERTKMLNQAVAQSQKLQIQNGGMQNNQMHPLQTPNAQMPNMQQLQMQNSQIQNVQIENLHIQSPHPQQHQFQEQGQFMDPGLMQMAPHPPYQNSAGPPHRINRTPSNFRQAPYPSPNEQPPSKRPRHHPRSQSISVTQDVAIYQGMHAQPAQRTPTMESLNMADRRFSMPQAMGPPTPQTPQPYQQSQHKQQNSYPARSSNPSPVYSHHSSSASTPMSQPLMTPPIPQPGHLQRPNSFAGPFHADINITQSMSQSLGPLTPTLPVETQHILAADPRWTGMNDGVLSSDAAFDSTMFNQTAMQQQHLPFYSYNPNRHNNRSDGKGAFSEPTFAGLHSTDQPLLSSGRETSQSMTTSAAADNSISADTRASNVAPAAPEQALGFSDFPDMFNFDAFNSSQSSGGHETPVGDAMPANDDLSNFVDDMFQP